MKVPPKIHWHLNRETRYPFGETSPNVAFFEPIGFPQPWSDRPWIFGNMVASANGVVAWERSEGDDPVLGILGIAGRYAKPMTNLRLAERAADKLWMRYLRSVGDCSIGAKTTREQPELFQLPKEGDKGNEPELQDIYEALYRFRESHGLPRHPRNVIYSVSGNLANPQTGQLDHTVFNIPNLQVILVTTNQGEDRLRQAGADRKGVTIIAEPELDAVGNLDAHQVLCNMGVQYLDCEGGETVLQTLHDAKLLDEVFVTTTDVVVDTNAHEGVKYIFDFQREGAELIAEGKVDQRGAYTFRRWRFNRR